MFRIWFSAALALGLMPAALVAAGQVRRPPPAAPICSIFDLTQLCQGRSLWGQPSQPARGALIPTGRGVAIANPDARQRGLERLAAAFAIPPAVRLAHPSGCPARAFCGCGAAVRIFGWPVRELWLAAEWPRRFPRAAPAPGMVGARPHHVIVLEQHIGGSIWLVYDANSGHHATQLHARSIAGFVIVNPRAG